MTERKATAETERRARATTRALEQFCDAFAQAVWANGFYQALRESSLGHLLRRDLWESSGQGDDGNASEPRDFAYGNRCCVSIEPRHLKIKDDQIREEVESFVHCLPAICGFLNNIALSFEDGA